MREVLQQEYSQPPILLPLHFRLVVNVYFFHDFQIASLQWYFRLNSRLNYISTHFIKHSKRPYQTGHPLVQSPHKIRTLSDRKILHVLCCSRGCKLNSLHQTNKYVLNKTSRQDHGGQLESLWEIRKDRLHSIVSQCEWKGNLVSKGKWHLSSLQAILLELAIASCLPFANGLNPDYIKGTTRHHKDHMGPNLSN